jgi:1,4-dihydroxy-2-naphthoate octaprenyltransferase
MKLSYLRQIIKLARLPIVFAVIPTFLVGALFALQKQYAFSWTTFLCGFLILFLIEIAASFANDYFDYEADKHNKQFGFSGGSGVLLQHPELLPFAKWGSITLFIFALVTTILFTWLASFPLWTISYIFVAVFFCWFYTAPPLRLVYRGLGEMPHFLAAVMFLGWGYLLITKTIDVSLIVFALPFGILGLTVILNFEIPDREADLNGGKQNFIVRLGRPSSFLVINCLYFLAFCLVVVFAITDTLSLSLNAWLLPFFFCIPFIMSLPPALKKIHTKETATPYAIRNAIAGFSTIALTAFYLFLLIVF